MSRDYQHNGKNTIRLQEIIQATPKKYLIITDLRPHSTIHHQGPSLSGCRCSYLEQFASACHFCTFIACLTLMPQDSSFYYFLSHVQWSCSDTCHFGHFNHSCYLLIAFIKQIYLYPGLEVGGKEVPPLPPFPFCHFPLTSPAISSLSSPPFISRPP